MKQIKYQIRYFLPVWFVLLITSWLPDNRFSIRARGCLVSLFLPNRPKKLTLGRDVTLLGIDNLRIGNNVYLAKGTWINAMGGIDIEDEVVVSPYVVIVSTAHGFLNNSVKQGGSHFAPVKIGKGTWIASHATIAAGAVLGKGCLLGANSVLNSSFEDNSFVAGMPAKFIKIRKDNPGSIKP